MADNDEQEQLDVEKLQEDLKQAIGQAEANLNGWKRAQADFENYRRRKESENKELLEFAKEVTVAKLLPTIDSLEQALRHVPAVNEDFRMQNAEFSNQYNNWQEGINVLLKQLDKTLGELGVKKIEAIGKKFDPLKHEAVREVESEQDDQTVVEELQSGFELNGKVIRPSQVVISKKSSK